MKTKFIWKPKVLVRLVFKSKRVSQTALAAAAVAALALYLVNWGGEVRLRKEDWAGWVQAVGSIAAVLLAVWVMHWQHARSLEREAESERSATLNMLKALHSDLSLFVPIVERRLACPRLVWPNLDVKLDVYRSFVGRIGLLKDHRLRMEILNVYMRIGMFFGSADHFSTVTGAIKPQLRLRGEERKRIDELWDEVAASGPGLLVYIVDTIGTLTGAIRELEKTKNHSGSPKTRP